MFGLGLALAVIACSTTVAPAPADPASPTVEDEESTEPPPADLEPYTQAEVQALFDERCRKCHGPTNALLDLSRPFTRETVGIATNTGQKKGLCANSAYVTRIVPGDREASLLWHKVKGTQDCGDRMPYEKGSKRLNATELERLGLWIDNLAKAD
jgi:hypothetical protein